jgi:hypothetical protein
MEGLKMNNTFIVLRNFTDKNTNKQYSIGEKYTPENQDRANELESGGYIAPENTEIAAMAKAEGEALNIVQAEAQQLAAAHTEAAQAAEPKTVVNGKVVALKEAQAAETAADQEIKKTGIRQAHDNSTEPVQAGMIAHDTQSQRLQALQQDQTVQAQQQAIRQADVQSGQNELEKAMSKVAKGFQQQQGSYQQGMQQQQNMQQQEMKAFEQSAQQMKNVQTGTKQADAMAAAEAAMITNPAAAVHEEAGQAQKAAAEIKTKGNRAQKQGE